MSADPLSLSVCPHWCTSDHAATLPASAYHTAGWTLPARFPGDTARPTVALSFELPGRPDAHPEDPPEAPEIALQPGPGAVPLGLTVAEARVLAAALTQAADLAAEHLPDACTTCGEPCQVSTHAGRCTLCAYRSGDLA